MGVENIIQEVTVVCDGPGCEVTGTSLNTADPIPDGWLTVWGPSWNLGKFFFHSGACYDNWKIESDALKPEESK